VINVHSRVDHFLQAIPPDWLVADFGCGDCYLSDQRPSGKTINIDSEEHRPEVTKIDLNRERPDIRGDLAVCSGLLEWVEDPLSLISWLFYSGRFPRVFFSYASIRGDPRWKYVCTIEQIVNLLMQIGCEVYLKPWAGQVLFFAQKL
jgi:hypothetical protein